MELWRFYKKVAKWTGWGFVILNFLEIKHQHEVIRFLSDKFGVYYLYSKWIKHDFLASYPMMISIVAEYDAGKGRNYQIMLKKLYGVN